MSLRYDHLVIGGGSAARDLRRGRTDRIATAIETVLAQPDLMRKRAEICRQNYSLPMLAQREYELLADVARRQPVDSAAKRVAYYIFPAAPEDALTAYPCLEEVET